MVLTRRKLTVLAVVVAVTAVVVVQQVIGGGYAHRTGAVIRPDDPVVAAAGDIACDPTTAAFHGGQGTAELCRQADTARLVLSLHPTAVLTLGDNQYECNTSTAFAASYEKSWGAFKDITHPAIGNHEYGKPCHRNDATPYFDYFSQAAGPRNQGWYSFDVGAWHLIALNSECSYGKGELAVGGCNTGSPQVEWLAKDLAAHHNACTLAYWHEPRFSSGEHGDAEQMTTIWNDLVAARVDVVLSGHNHDYERFEPLGSAPMDSASPGSGPVFQNPTPDKQGIREFVVGTGGKNFYSFAAPMLKGEQVRADHTYGVLRLALHANSYSWDFKRASGNPFVDRGSGTCH